MAKIIAMYNPARVVAVDTNINELEFHQSILSVYPYNIAQGVPKEDYIKITVRVGTFRFSTGSGTNLNLNTLTKTVGDSFYVSITNGLKNLFFKSNAINDEFEVSF